MSVRYNKLLNMLIGWRMSTAQSVEEARVSAKIVTWIKRNKYFLMDTAEKLCNILSCGSDILKFMPDTEKSNNNSLV